MAGLIELHFSRMDSNEVHSRCLDGALLDSRAQENSPVYINYKMAILYC